MFDLFSEVDRDRILNLHQNVYPMNDKPRFCFRLEPIVPSLQFSIITIMNRHIVQDDWSVIFDVCSYGNDFIFLAEQGHLNPWGERLRVYICNGRYRTAFFRNQYWTISSAFDLSNLNELSYFSVYYRRRWPPLPPPIPRSAELNFLDVVPSGKMVGIDRGISWLLGRKKRKKRKLNLPWTKIGF